MKKGCLIGVLIFAINIYANVITVDVAGGGDYLTIHEAVTAASAGDSIIVMSGQYDFTASLGTLTIDKQLYLIGSGYDLVSEGGTKLQDISGTGLIIITGNADGTVIKGFQMETTGLVLSITDNAKQIVIEENYFYGSTTINAANSQQDTIRHNILLASGSNVILATCDDMQFVNNIVIGGSGYNTSRCGVLISGSSGSIIANNVVMKAGDSYTARQRAAITVADDTDVYSNVLLDCLWGICVTSGNSPYITNNCYYGNSNDGELGQSTVSGDPLFVNFSSGDTYDADSPNEDEYDFQLDTGSPCINAGRVGPAYNDIDGTQNDIGLFGGPWPFSDDFGIPTIPVVSSISVTPGLVSPSGSITINATGRIGSESSAKKAAIITVPGTKTSKPSNNTSVKTNKPVRSINR